MAVVVQGNDRNVETAVVVVPCVAGARRGGGRRKVRGGKEKGAPAVRAGVLVFRPPIST